MTEKELDNKVSDIGQDAYQKAAMAVKETMLRLKHETNSRNGADYIRAGFYGALGALVPAAILIAKRKNLPEGVSAPTKPEEVKPEHGDFVYSNARPETMTFAALLLAQMLEKVTYEVTSIAFGPIQLREALAQWKLLFPLAKPEDWFEQDLLNCIAAIEEQSRGPVKELMAKIQKASPGSTTLH